MSHAKMNYFETEDVLHVTLSDEPEANSLEISPNITAELNEAGELIGIEILHASAFLRDVTFERSPAISLTSLSAVSFRNLIQVSSYRDTF